MDHVVGKNITLISKSEIRYEGKLDRIDATNSNITLSSVKCHGTEGRRDGGPPRSGAA